MSSANPAQGNRAARAKADLARAAPPSFLAAVAAKTTSRNPSEATQQTKSGTAFSSLSSSTAARASPSTKNSRPRHTNEDSAAADARQFREWGDETTGAGFNAPAEKKAEAGRDAVLRGRLLGKGRGGRENGAGRDDTCDGKRRGARSLEDEDDDEDEGRSGLGRGKRRAKRKLEENPEKIAESSDDAGDKEAPDEKDDGATDGVSMLREVPEQGGDEDILRPELGDVPMEGETKRRKNKKRKKNKQSA